MTTFKLSPPNEFIPLDKLLKLVGMVGSGGEAHAVITDGLVKVNATEIKAQEAPEQTIKDGNLTVKKLPSNMNAEHCEQTLIHVGDEI
ncbi:MAG: RNA-binding S4 domain-containing protein [Flavobacteriales bacterium]